MPISLFILPLTEHLFLCWLQPRRRASEIASLGTWHIPPLSLIFPIIFPFLLFCFLRYFLSIPSLFFYPCPCSCPLFFHISTPHPSHDDEGLFLLGGSLVGIQEKKESAAQATHHQSIPKVRSVGLAPSLHWLPPFTQATRPNPSPPCTQTLRKSLL